MTGLSVDINLLLNDLSMSFYGQVLHTLADSSLERVDRDCFLDTLCPLRCLNPLSRMMRLLDVNG